VIRIAHTTVYNKDGIGVYAIMGTWDKSSFRSNWIPYHLFQYMLPEAQKIISSFKGKEYKTQLPRWHKVMCEALVTMLRSHLLGYSVEIKYPTLEISHTRHLTIKAF
jgi:hypothetical protein